MVDGRFNSYAHVSGLESSAAAPTPTTAFSPFSFKTTPEASRSKPSTRSVATTSVALFSYSIYLTGLQDSGFR